jgi:hypothetical protein
MKIGKINRKRKKRRGFLLTRLGGILVQPSEGARVGRGPSRPTSGGRCGDGAVGAGPHASEGEGDDVTG